jgi:hypothetical protein
MSDERDEALIAAWMRKLAAQPVETSPLPDPAYIWWKAQLLRQWDAQRTAVAPLEWGERIQVATGVGGAAVLLALSWPLFPAIATGVLALTAALAAGWWRQSLTHD